MPDRRPRPLSALLARPGEALAALLDRVRRTGALTGAVQRALPGELAAHVVAAALRQRQLVVYTDAAVWAARLRFSEEELRQRLAAQGIHFERLRPRVRPAGGQGGGLQSQGG